MKNRFLNGSLLLIAIFISSWQASAQTASRTITFYPNTSQDAQEISWVSFGLPLERGAVETAEDLRILDGRGKPVALFAKALLMWGATNGKNGSIRSLKVQMQVTPEPGGATYTFDFGGRDTVADLEEQPISVLTAPSPTSGKEGVQEPIVIAVVNPVYLASTGLIPPYLPAQGDAYDRYIGSQFDRDWGPFDFETGRRANWLFDRTTTLYKYAMRSGRPEVYLEAYRSFQWWRAHHSQTGDCIGGFDYEGKACDSKYIYTEPVKLHLALSGDDSAYDASFVKSMADTAWEQCWGGRQGLKSPYTNVNQALTERHIGLTLLAQVNAYEITRDPALLERIKEGIENIHRTQNGPNPDGLPNDGSLRHSWFFHEGDLPYLGVIAKPAAANTRSITLEKTGDIRLVDTGAPLAVGPEAQAAASGRATENSDGTWTVPLARPLTAEIAAGETIRWADTTWTMIPSDRGFSPWMFENISDAMWHAYAVVDDPDLRAKIETYFTEAGKALALYGFVPESLHPSTREGLEAAYGHTYTNFGVDPRAWADGCSQTTPILLYFGSSVAPHNTMAASKYRYSDQHNPETILTLSLASHFEENEAKRVALTRLVEDLSRWFESDCADSVAGRGLPWRGFNWQHRSNAWGTQLWVKQEASEAP